MKIVRRIIYDLIYIILNSIINHIPIWWVRKLCYQFFGMKIGKRARIGIRTIVIEPWKIRIGDRTVINEDCYLNGAGGLDIGSDVSISIYTKILTASHLKDSDDFQYVTGRVIIENKVWVGIGAIILMSSRIREKAIIGAGAVFNGDSVEKGIYFGIPARLSKQREIGDEYKIEYTAFFR